MNPFGILGVLLLVLVFGLPGAAHAGFDDGIAAYRNQDYATALQEWRPLAAENDSRALYNLGQMYRLGQGVPKDAAIAEQYYRRASKQGHAASRGNLGSIYFTSNPPRIDEALYYWRSAARAGDARSQFLLGVQYFNGENVKRDYVLSYAWISLAAKAGLKDARESMSVLEKYLSESDIAEGLRLAKTFTKPEPRPATDIDQQVAIQVAPSKEPPRVKPPVVETPMVQVEPAAPARPATVSQTTAPPAPAKVEDIVPAGKPAEATVWAPDDKFRIQIAALRSEASAEDYWQRSSTKRPDLMASLSHYIVQADVGDRGLYYRLQLGNFEQRSAALSLCQDLQQTGLSCFVVATP
jgi:hypothetical protein